MVGGNLGKMRRVAEGAQVDLAGRKYLWNSYVLIRPMPRVHPWELIRFITQNPLCIIDYWPRTLIHTIIDSTH